MAESRRVKLTKKLMKDALLELMEEKPLEKISVTDVCRVADVNRSSFYAYYQDIMQLAEEIVQDVLLLLPTETKDLYDYSTGYTQRVLADFFDYIRENEWMFRILIIRYDNQSFNDRLIATVMDKYGVPLMGDTELERRYSYTYVTNGVMGMLRAWIVDNFPISSAELAKLVLNMTKCLLKPSAE